MANDVSLERFLLPSEAARILGCSAARVRGLVDSGELPAEDRPGVPPDSFQGGRTAG